MSEFKFLKVSLASCGEQTGERGRREERREEAAGGPGGRPGWRVEVVGMGCSRIDFGGRRARTIGGVLSWGGVRKREEMGTWRDLNPAVRLQLLTNK